MSIPGLSEIAQQVLNGLPPDIYERYDAAIKAIGDNPYGAGTRLFADPGDPYDRVTSLGDGWIRYTVRPLAEPEVVVTDLDWHPV